MLLQMTFRVCEYCKEYKIITKFAASKATPGGRRAHCRECVVKFSTMSIEQLSGVKKFCTQCKQELQLLSFSYCKSTGNGDRRRSYCNECKKRQRLPYAVMKTREYARILLSIRESKN
jgi:hypothetical protein